jgi:hypothetical protein
LLLGGVGIHWSPVHINLPSGLRMMSVMGEAQG